MTPACTTQPLPGASLSISKTLTYVISASIDDAQLQGKTLAHEPITLQQLQDTVNQWISQWEGGYWAPLENLARLTEEVGELARELNHAHGPKKKKPSEAESSVALELGDILFVVVSIANSLDISLDDAMRQTMEKYRIRDSDRFERRNDE